MACSKCGGETVFKSGVSKSSGKPYAGHKCTVCDNFDFQRKVEPPSAAPKPVAPVNNDKIELLKLAVQMAIHGTQPGAMTIETVAIYFEQLKKVLSGTMTVDIDGEDVPF